MSPILRLPRLWNAISRTPWPLAWRRLYLDEFVFRFNRRRTPQAAFASLLGLAAQRDHASYHMLIHQT